MENHEVDLGQLSNSLGMDMNSFLALMVRARSKIMKEITEKFLMIPAFLCLLESHLSYLALLRELRSSQNSVIACVTMIG